MAEANLQMADTKIFLCNPIVTMQVIRMKKF